MAKDDHLDSMLAQLRILRARWSSLLDETVGTSSTPEVVDLVRVGRQLLSCIALEQKLLTDLARYHPALVGNPSLDVVWSAMLQVPPLRALLLRDQIRDQVLANLKRMMEDDS